jgi:hypothetical protein
MNLLLCHVLNLNETLAVQTLSKLLNWIPSYQVKSAQTPSGHATRLCHIYLLAGEVSLEHQPAAEWEVNQEACMVL